MLIKGEKYACDACVRGHRVSSCTHTDRPLIHINKKGRPVSQCPHCRGLRKARAQHVKCDCAEKPHTKEECPHDKTEVKKGEQKGCCCAHGARCTCSLKKEHALDPVPEDLPQAMDEPRVTKERSRPPKISTASPMESKMTVFINGHHKPVHKVNDIHNRVGAPYKIPARSHTIPGNRVDFTQRSTDSLPLTKDLLNFHTNPHFHASVTSAPQPVRRQAKSEHGSPTINALPIHLDNHVPPISIPPYDPNAYSYSPFGSGSPTISSAGSDPWAGKFPDQFPDNYFVTYERANEMENPVTSAGLGSDSAEVNWATYNLPNRFSSAAEYRLSNGGAVPSQPPSYASFDGFSHLSHPGLTSSSGDVSDVEDYVPVSESTILQNSSQDVLNDFSSVGGDELNEPETFRLSSASSYIGMPQARMLASDNLDSLDIDEYLKSAEAHTRELALRNQRMQQQTQQQLDQAQAASNMPHIFTPPSDAGQHSFSVQEAQERAHTRNQDGISGLENSPLTTTSLRNDPILSSDLTGVNGMMDADERDDGWVR
ncbi:hypothetical protein GJ744_005135 [Endocarpon pusillum]|uniref:Copper-fist domain-containing protein n=1 Tax=Endocarpon pusillum TaxID=364733 RepID=A0A8H7ALC3_9EURO|nr:hypothetical protein GJ744_005135 [Endocarpon pusillum]